jgi:hypothetical protein
MRSFTLSSVMIALAAHASNFAGPDQFICGTATFMQANALATGESGFWSVAQGAGTFLTPGSPNSGVTGLSFGENVLRWTVFTSAGQVSDLVSVWCYNSAMPAADAGPDQTVNHWPGTAQLNGSSPVAPGACFWQVLSGSASIAAPTDPNSAVSGLGEGITVLQWTCDNGPCGTTSDLVTIDAVVGIPEVEGRLPAFRFDPVDRLLWSAAPVRAQVLDAAGRVVAAGQLGPSAPLSLAHAPSGHYVALAAQGERIVPLRIVLP